MIKTSGVDNQFLSHIINNDHAWWQNNSCQIGKQSLGKQILFMDILGPQTEPS